MAGWDIVQKAFYLGVGIASYAGEKAGGKLSELRTQAQKLAEEMVERGEMTAEEARQAIDELVRQAQAQQPTPEPEPENSSREPRRIEILAEDESPADSASGATEAERLRQQLQDLQAELRRLKQD